MPPAIVRPEAILRRSAELLAVNQPLAALQSISEIFASKRFRSTPLSSLEPIMLKFVELCVDLRKGRHAKEGLHLYKNVTQNTSVVTVETVITLFLKRSKDKVQEALAKVDEIEGPATDSADAAAKTTESSTADEAVATAVVPAEVEDLEASETPESILLSAVSDEKSRDRTYRTIVMPWLRFLWEAYRTSLDILRNNARLENLYQQVAHEAFDFCLTHQRKTEFRRLCETLRSHLSSSQKYAHQTHSINLSDPDTLQRHLDTRFHQLNTAVDLELWQEAFRTAEDIHGLVGLSKRLPKGSMLATYFEKLVKVFAVGNNFLFHAAAYGRYHSLQNVKDEDAEKKAANLALLSALAVPIANDAQARRRDGSAFIDSESMRNKATRLAALLGLQTTPTRSDLLRDVLKRDALSSVSPQLRSLYNILEVDFHPLLITKKIDPILQSLAADSETARYVEPLKEVVLSRLFSQLGQVYDSLKLEKAIRLATFASEAEEPSKARSRIERYIAGACRRGDLDVTFDHAGACIQFDQDLFGSIAATSQDAQVGEAALQASPASLLRGELARLAQTLYTAVSMMQVSDSPQSQAQENKTAALAQMAAELKSEHKALLARKSIIEKRKAEADELAVRREKEEAANRASRIQAKADELARKEKEDAIRRQTELVRKQAEEAKKQEQRELAQALLSKRGIRVDIPDASAGDSDVIKLTVEAIEREKRDLAEKIRVVGKRMDHLERAFRKEEQPILVEDYHRQQSRDRKAFERAQEQRVQDLKDRHKADLANKQRLQAFLPDYTAFRQEKEAQAIASNAEAEAESKRKIEKERKKRRDQLRQQREADMQAAAEEERQRIEQERLEREESELREAEEAENRRRLEEENAAEEERKRKAAEDAEAAAAKRKAEREADRMKMDEQARKQREREEEIEAKLKARKSGVSTSAPIREVPGSSLWRRSAASTTAGESKPAAPDSAANGAAPSKYVPKFMQNRGNQPATTTAPSAAPLIERTGENKPPTPASAETDGFKPVAKGAYKAYKPPGSSDRAPEAQNTRSRW